MTAKRYLVTGGTGFIGSALVSRLLERGHRVRVLDNNSRGSERRLGKVIGDVELMIGDIRSGDFVEKAVEGVDAVHHLAFVNGTENFYNHPELVLEVGAKGMINVVDACIKHGVRELILASSSEVYQSPPQVPTDERVPLVVPDLMNPRYSYGGGKLFSELYAINVAARRLDRVVIYRPHNVYGPDMGWEHVIPQFATRMVRLALQAPSAEIDFQIQGSGRETRSFCFIDDFVDGLELVQERGTTANVYHIGTTEEVTMADLAQRIAGQLGRKVKILPGPIQAGSTLRRCPSIDKLAGLGYRQRIPLDQGLAITCQWYFENQRTCD
ncbi:MAG TPA: NAD-dependent epimerase/dehydratase family protein [Steroidobacteraceae bacterium]|nr:NAD-dependent epimerase/dehydratase family protein [Steroidobacteraceae bacterium]